MANAIVKTHRGPVEVAEGPFAAAIKAVAKSLGLQAFRVFVAGVEVVDESLSPANLTIDMVVAIQPDDLAG